MAIMAAACTSDEGTSKPTAATRSEKLPQPIVENLNVAPESERVDVTLPEFSNPTEITNPLFPVSKQESVLLLGRVDGKPFRTEVTLLPDTRIVEWQGHQIRTVVSQYVAYLGGRLNEVAFDLYAQADDGSVWYFGEDVSDFEDGVIVTKEGTWIVPKDGPPAMIMAAEPKVGQVFRAENIPGIAFEEVTVTSVDETLDGPLGPIEGGMVGEELHMDESTSEKIFAPGYGEFYTAHGGDIESVALAVPTDAVGGAVPQELSDLESGAAEIFNAAESGDWATAVAADKRMSAAWDTYSADEVPKLIEPRMTRSLEALAEAVGARNPAQARQAAIDTGQWSLDLQLRYRPAVEVDLGRFGLWAAQLQVDASREDASAANGDFFTLDLIRDRILHALDEPTTTRINLHLEDLETGVFDKDYAAVMRAAEQLRETLAQLELTG